MLSCVAAIVLSGLIEWVGGAAEVGEWGQKGLARPRSPYAATLRFGWKKYAPFDIMLCSDVLSYFIDLNPNTYWRDESHRETESYTENALLRYVLF